MHSDDCEACCDIFRTSVQLAYWISSSGYLALEGRFMCGGVFMKEAVKPLYLNSAKEFNSYK